MTSLYFCTLGTALTLPCSPLSISRLAPAGPPSLAHTPLLILNPSPPPPPQPDLLAHYFPLRCPFQRVCTRLCIEARDPLCVPTVCEAPDALRPAQSSCLPYLKC